MRNVLILGGLVGMFLGWNTPNHYPLWTTFHGEFAAAVGVCLVLAGVLWPLTGSTGSASHSVRVPVPLPWAAKIWLIVGLLPALQYLSGQLDFYGDALLGFLYFAGVGLSLYAGRLWAAQAGVMTALRWFFLTVLLSALAAGGLAFWQWVRLPTPGWWAMDLINSRPYANFAQPNLFGLLTVMGIVAASALFEMRILERRLSYWIVLLFLGGALLVSESRAALVAVLSVAGLWFATRGRAPTRLHWYEVVGVLALGWVAHNSLNRIEEAVYLNATAARSVLEVGPREAIWLHFWAAIREHPWLGYGFNQGVAALREVAAHVQPSRNTIYAHNVVLDLLTWFGIPLGVAMTGALLAWMASWLKKTESGELMAQRHCALALWLALLVQSLLEFPFAHAFFILPAALLAGAATCASRPSPSDVRFVATAPALAFAALTTALLGLVAWDYLQFEAEFRANRFDKGNFVTPSVHEPQTGPIMLDQLAALNASARYKIRRGMPRAEIEQLARLARRFHLLPTRFEYAKALALNGRMPEANDELLMIRGIYHPKLWNEIERDWQDWLVTEHLEPTLPR